MKIVIVGGHLTPALAVIKKLDKKDEIYYFGRKCPHEGDRALSLEYQEISKLGIPFYSIKTARLQRRFTRYTLPSLFKMPVGFYQSLKLLRKLKPDVILAFGGYLSIPVVISAHLLKIPTVIHEQTFEAGLANKTLSNFANKILISWESSRGYFPKNKTILTGNPVKEEIISVKNQKSIKKENLTIYITGGSTGAHAINVLVEENLEGLLKNYYLVHQTGDSKRFNDFEKLTNKKNGLPLEFSKKYTVTKFFNSLDSANVLNQAELVIGRAGVNTVTELAYLEKPALLIPLSVSQKNEQLKNALFLKDLGLAEVLDQNEVTNNLFMEKIHFMMSNINNYKIKNKIEFKDSPREIVKILKDVSKQKTT